MEMAVLSLDEREQFVTTFALYDAEEVVLLGDGDSIQNMLTITDICFDLADVLATINWGRDKETTQLNVDVLHVLGAA